MQKQVIDSELLPKKGELYKHHKGGIYVIERLCMNAADSDMMILYNGFLASNVMPVPWIGSGKSWSTQVNGEPRFTFLGFIQDYGNQDSSEPSFL